MKLNQMTWMAAGFFGIVSMVSAQSSMRASISGRGGDSGKCTIEVEVDDAADVEIRQDMGRIHTLNGQRANFRRFQCNQPMPVNMAEFRFRGIDGRGRVELVRDPRSNRGVAVVRIHDPKGGREGYTFDLEWRGAFAGGNNSGWRRR
ncbi:MAG: hypothetical protein JST93_10765 [Acidobacteria bacterium]|nr:hypothetical protein [Acidobacteriota bacterium]